MQIKAQELSQKLTHDLAKLIWVSGDEPLLVNKLCDVVIDKATKQGFVERELLIFDSKLKWDNLFALLSSRSLFSDKKIIDWRLESLSLGRDSAKQIKYLLNLLSDDVLLLIRSPKLTNDIKKLKWTKLLDTAGWFCAVWTVEPNKLPNWIINEAKRMGIFFNQDAATALAIKTEGNLLCAYQEIEKLKLQGLSKIDVTTIDAQTSDNSKFDVFKLTDCILSGDASKAIKIFRMLIAEGIALQIILWAIAKDLRDLAYLEFNKQSPKNYQPLEFVPPFIWQKRQILFVKALATKRRFRFGALLQSLLIIDKASKGMGTDSINRTERLILQITGKL